MVRLRTMADSHQTVPPAKSGKKTIKVDWRSGVTWVALAVTIVWVFVVIRLPEWLQPGCLYNPFGAMIISPAYCGKAMTFNEWGDYLTGFLTPPALFWFVWTLFLQKRELKYQREELEQARVISKDHIAVVSASATTDAALVFLDKKDGLEQIMAKRYQELVRLIDKDWQAQFKKRREVVSDNYQRTMFVEWYEWLVSVENAARETLRQASGESARESATLVFHHSRDQKNLFRDKVLEHNSIYDRYIDLATRSKLLALCSGSAAVMNHNLSEMTKRINKPEI